MKFLKYLAQYLVYPFSFLVPRSRKKIAFGSFRGAFDGNAKYLFIEMSSGDRDVVWLSQSRKTVELVRSLGLRAEWVFSLKGAWRALRSKYWLINAYTSDILWAFSGGATVINLWHGVGIKRAEYNVKAGPLYDRYIRKTFKESYYHPEAYRKPDYLITASDFQTEFFMKTFRIPQSRCIKCGYPRSRILVCSEKEREAHIKAYEPESTSQLIEKIKSYSQAWIYMPTWRDSQREIFAQNMDLGRLNEALARKNALLLLKPHPNTIVGDLGAYPNIMLMDSSADVYPMLPYTDVLVTDYSSVLYDYLLMDGKKAVLYIYDAAQYVRDRDFAYPFDENVTGQKAYDFEQLLEAIVEGPKPVDPEARKSLILKFWGPKPVDYDFSNYLHL